GKAWDRPVDHDAHRPFGGVGTHIDHRLGEALIGHAGQGNQKLAFEKAFALINFRVLRRCHGDSLFAGTPDAKSIAIAGSAFREPFGWAKSASMIRYEEKDDQGR